MTGPLPFTHSINVTYPNSRRHHHSNEKSIVQEQEQTPDAAYRWTSRNNRKGRHALAISPEYHASTANTPRPTTRTRHILQIVWLMLVSYPYWDISWWVATLFTWGSIVWVINAFFVFLPTIKPPTTFNNELLYGGGITAFIGATIFEIGSILLMIESINEDRSECFGWEVKHIIEHGVEEKEQDIVLKSECRHHHSHRHSFVHRRPNGELSNGSDTKKDEIETERREWKWWPPWTDLKHYYLHQIGFIASGFQMAGATIFWIAGFTALPGIQNKLSQPLLDGIYWTPQVVGGMGFVISGTLFMIETQKRWWKPALHVLGWHIGFWNLIGGLGFTLSPIFGYYPYSWGQYQAGCSTFWGSWAFLIGSVIQLYESLDKYPVTVETLG